MINIKSRTSGTIKNKVFFFSLLLLILSITAVNGEDSFDEWFDKDARLQNYLEIKDKMKEIFKNASENNIPTILLYEKAEEGLAKKVDRSKLIDALRLEADRLKVAHKIILEAGESVRDNEKKSLYKGISIFLIGGLNESQILFFFEETGSRKKPISYFLALGNALIASLSIVRLNDSDILTLGASIINANLAESAITSISSFFIKGQLKRIDTGDLLFIIIDILDNGGGILQIERELDRRTRGR